ncbi:MAG: nuclear transport factor 2 family protein [Bdellovibrio sp.]|nr:nuclear transport factor 2 family protein [Bdellovibrio sp.]
MKNEAIDFLHLVSSGNVDEAFEKYIDPNFQHHNQYFRGDRESLRLAMKENAITMPNKSFATKMVLEDGAIVVTYSHVIQKPSELEIAVVHIMRFQDDRIIEMWDVEQTISKDSPNENGMF